MELEKPLGEELGAVGPGTFSKPRAGRLRDCGLSRGPGLPFLEEGGLPPAGVVAWASAGAQAWPWERAGRGAPPAVRVSRDPQTERRRERSHRSEKQWFSFLFYIRKFFRLPSEGTVSSVENKEFWAFSES